MNYHIEWKGKFRGYPLKIVIFVIKIENMKLIEINMEKIATLCIKYKVKCLYVFGSILTDRFNNESDIDFAVNFDKERIESEKTDWADLFFDFIHDLEELLGRKVDMVVDDAIKNRYFKQELDNTKKLIYG